MRWIGQHIWNFVSRFRGDIYLENLTSTNETSVLVADSDGKVSRRLTIGGGDITGVDLTGGDAISIASETNTGSGSYSATINHDNTSSQTSVNNSGSTYIQDVTLDTYGHVTALTSAPVPILNQDTSGNAATATLAGGLSATLAVNRGGTGETTVQASMNALAGGVNAGRYLRGDGSDVVLSAIQVGDIGGLGVSNFNADNIQLASETFSDNDTSLMTSAAIDDRINTGDAAIASDTLTFTNKTFDANGAGNSLSNVEVADLAAAAIQTSGESFADNDTSLMTSAAIDDKINTKYSTSYITFSAKSTSSYGTNYVMIHANGISESTFSVNSNVDSAGDFGGVTTEEGGSGTDATATVASGNLEQQIPIPETCKLIGFYATTTTSTNSGAAYDTGVAIWHVPESGVNWGSSTASTATLIHKSDSSRHTEGSNRKKVQKVERMDGTAKTLGAGDILIPSVFGETSNQQIMATITLVIATPIKTI